jgi:hypothetical protein
MRQTQIQKLRKPRTPLVLDLRTPFLSADALLAFAGHRASDALLPSARRRLR